MLGSAESEMVRLISREIIFAEFQPMITIPQCHRQTDGQTTCLGNSSLRVASRGNNNNLQRRNCQEYFCSKFTQCSTVKNVHKNVKFIMTACIL